MDRDSSLLIVAPCLQSPQTDAKLCLLSRVTTFIIRWCFGFGSPGFGSPALPPPKLRSVTPRP